MNSPVQEVTVVGGGSAGLLSAITMKRHLPALRVRLVYSSKIPVIGVGEGTTRSMPPFIHGFLGIPPTLFHHQVKPTYKRGIKFLWGPRDHFHYTFTNQLDIQAPDLSKPNGFYCFDDFLYADVSSSLMEEDMAFEKSPAGLPIVQDDVAYHLENQLFLAFLDQEARRLGVQLIDDEITEVTQTGDGISELKLKSGASVSSDLFIDCSGFRSELIGKALNEPFMDFSSSLFCDRAIFGGWERTDEDLKPYTTAETMNSGWAWQIEHDHLINRGYVFSSKFVSDEEAEREFRERNPKVTDTRLLRFSSGIRRRRWVKNVVAIGNSAGFVEPLEATSLTMITDHLTKLALTLADSDLTIRPKVRELYNRVTDEHWQAVRCFLALHYKFNTRLDTEFWQACRNDSDLAGAENIVEYYQQCGPGTLWADSLIGRDDPFGWEGYLAILHGQKVPTDRLFHPPREEIERWKGYQKSFREKGKSGMNLHEALQIIRSKRWKWNPRFYENIQS